MKTIIKFFSIAAAAVMLNACAMNQAAPERTPAERLLGTWQANIQGQSMNLTYDGSNIDVGQGMMIPYSVEGDQITVEIPQQGSQTSTLTFRSDNEFVSTTPQGQETVFTRVTQ